MMAHTPFPRKDGLMEIEVRTVEEVKSTAIIGPGI
jgi:hypothetical protein